MKVLVDEARCVGAGTCVMAAEQVFDQRDEDGIVVLLDDAPPPDAHDAVREAAMLCPAAAILLEESP
ncbi:ferredoxin [Amycolatopsis sp. 195334CR]|uniref:ferredoxin n=1 Tax=Amycolatopsis sp. 195334CR TaxID=2814588 RepID=UPI001A8F1A5E|nr:ferredoxin [Amycolatopsis sp. 195334CR]MBN6042084.1 ferredoxin [Amycolatopsis sp. 195334CR]